MRRLFHIFLNVTTVLSLMLCVATLAMWVHGDDWVFVSRPSVQLLRQTNGVLFYDRIRFDTWGVEAESGRPVWAQFIEKAAQAPMMSRAPDQWVDRVEHLFGIEFFRFTGPINFYTGGLVKPNTASPFGDVQYRSYIEPIHAVHVGLPCYLLVLLAGALPVGRFATYAAARHKERGRQRDRRCPACGYDCRATPDRCPECGAAAPAAQPARPGGAGG